MSGPLGQGPPGARPAPASAAERLLSIDCLRGCAALAVFIFHVSVVAGFPRRTLPPLTLFHRTYTGLLSPLPLGASGVNLFFVISGFCLAFQQWRAGRDHLFSSPGQQALRAYARNRVARIGPAYWVTVLVSAALVLALYPVSRAWLALDTLLHLAFLHGLHPRTFLSLHGGLWSMATEVQFYLVFPLLLWLFARLGGLWAVVLAVLFNGAFRVAVAFVPFPETAGMSSWSSVLAYQLPGRLLEFVLGMGLAGLYLRRDAAWASRFRLLWVPTLLVALACRGFGPAYLPDMAFGLFYFALCGAVLLWPQRRSEFEGSGLHPGRGVVWAARFGRASYSFFLIHYPLLLLLERLGPFPGEALYRRFLFLLLLGLPLSLLLAVVLYLGVELPLWRRWRALP